LHAINIDAKDKQALSKKFGNGGFINYKDALAELRIDLSQATVGEEKWTLAQPK